MNNKLAWIETYTGKAYYPTDPFPEEICIEDIAHSLSLQCRYNGHCKEFYSVAQHSVLVSEINPCLEALLHDAAEAYVGDMVKPLKDNSNLGRHFKAIENLNQWAIAQKFGLKEVDIKEADLILLATEARDLMTTQGKNWILPFDPLPDIIIPWLPKIAEESFLTRFKELNK